MSVRAIRRAGWEITTRELPEGWECVVVPTRRTVVVDPRCNPHRLMALLMAVALLVGDRERGEPPPGS